MSVRQSVGAEHNNVTWTVNPKFCEFVPMRVLDVGESVALWEKRDSIGDIIYERYRSV